MGEKGVQVRMLPEGVIYGYLSERKHNITLAKCPSGEFHGCTLCAYFIGKYERTPFFRFHRI